MAMIEGTITLLALVAIVTADYGDPRKGSCAAGDSECGHVARFFSW